MNIDDGFLNLMTQDGTAKDDVRVPEGDLGKQIQSEFEEGKDLLVTIISAMGEEQVMVLFFVTYISPLTEDLSPGHLCEGGSERVYLMLKVRLIPRIVA